MMLWQVVKILLQEVKRLVLLFATKFVDVVRFTGPLQTCFAANDVAPLYGLTPANFYPIRSLYPRNSQQPDLL